VQIRFAGQLAGSTSGAKHNLGLGSLKPNMKRSQSSTSPDSTDKVRRLYGDVKFE
jgi:hypothetical protein